MGIRLGGAHIDENGRISGGRRGDNTGKEVSIGDWYRGWSSAYRHPDSAVGAKLAQAMCDACANDNIGYDQSYRVAKVMAQKYGSLAAISELCATDCSELVSACIWQATGIDCPSFSTHTMHNWLTGHGFSTFTPNEGNVYNGDILLKSGHTEMVVSGRPRTGQNDPVEGGGTAAGGYTSSELYSTRNTRKDMVVREVGYLNSACEPSMTASELNLSVINYTTLLADLFRELVPETMLVGSNGSTDTSKLTGNCKIVVNYLIDKGLNAAAACGVAGNIYHESSFNTAAIGDYNTSFGICQWHLGRGDRMKAACGSNWKNNLTGQLDFLWSELNGSYKNTVLTPLQDVANSEAGCRKAADVFVRKFEIPANVDNESKKRQETAVNYYRQCVVLST